MEKVSFSTCVNTPMFKSTFQTVQTPSQSYYSVFYPTNQPYIDTVQIRSKKDIQLEKLNRLFPNGGIEQLYNEINKDFGIINIPSLKLYGDNDGITAGGYTFNKNEISLSLSDLLDSDTKLVGIKDGKRTILTSPKIKLPLFVDKKTAQYFIYSQYQKGNMGYDQIVAEPVTPDEQRKFIAQKMAHEVVHAQQHQTMCQTEDIGAKEVYKAWTHFKPQNLIEKYVFDFKSDNSFKYTYWGKKTDTEKIYSITSREGQFAKIWLDAVENYPPVDSPEYENNAIEKDAYERSAAYADSKFGTWN